MKILGLFLADTSEYEVKFRCMWGRLRVLVVV